MSAPYTMTWVDSRGSGRCITTSNIEDITRRLQKLRANATVRNVNGDVIGECHDRHAHDLPGNQRWVWWIDNDG